jgi:hypothetical protein
MYAAEDAIRADRLAHHVYCALFGKVSKLEDGPIVEGAKAAVRLAAIAQGFINTVAQKTDLARARALKKHADNNVALLQIASAGFAGTLRRIKKEANTVSLSEAIVPAARRAAERVQARLALPTAPEAVEEELPTD